MNKHVPIPAPAVAGPKKINKEYTHLEMEAALCVWECLCEWTLGQDVSPGAPLFRPKWAELREAVGSVEMRHQSILLGKWCLAIYDICTKHNENFFDGVAYDWEVIPLMLGYACNDDGPAIYAEHLPAPEKAALLVMHQHLRTEFVSACRHEAQKQWAYGDLVEDNPPDIDRGFESGEEPAAFIKSLGESLDLIDFGPWK